jgi:hypothetical protein
MTPRERYIETKRLKAERNLHQEQKWAAARCGEERDNLMEVKLNNLMDSMERIADVLELWADKQEDGK